MACIDRDIIIYHTETKKDYDALIDDLDKKGYMWQSFMPLKIRDYWGVYQEKTCIGVRSEGKNVFCSSFSTLIHSHEIYKYEAKEDIEMKIYHTETQADYDALMKKLEAEGIEALPKEYWPTFKTETAVVVRAQSGEKRNWGNGTTYGNLSRVRSRYDTPITTYKAKADEKMKFTKENIYKVFSQYRKDSNYSLNDLQDEILKLDDTPEKVVVPKCFGDWYREIKGYWKSDSSAKQFALWKLCQQGFGHSFEDVRGRKISYASDLARWLRKNEMLAIDAILNGYTIEKEVLYYIPLPHLKTTDGIQQVLTKRSKNGRHYFASRPNEKLKQRYTKEELEQVPEVYKPFAKPIDEVIQNEF